jgi:hypothetical protein
MIFENGKKELVQMVMSSWAEVTKELDKFTVIILG